jgi:uncharacterized protein YdaU (DUF1376 family)
MKTPACEAGAFKIPRTTGDPSPCDFDAQVAAPEHHNDRRRFLVWALMLGAVPPQRVVERVLDEIEAEGDGAMSDIGHWMPLYIGDYLADTRRLTLTEHGAYLLLIFDYWRSGPLPDSDRELARILGVTLPTWKKLAPTLRPMFQTEGELLRHKRIDEERAKAESVRANAVDRARHAADMRWHRDDASSNAPSNARSNAPSIQQAVLEQCPPPPPSTEEPKPLRAIPSRSPGFDRFWKTWPASKRKVDRKKCADKWRRSGLDAQGDAIIAQVEAMKRSKQWRDGYEPAPLTYLNGERWTDPLPPELNESSEMRKVAV